MTGASRARETSLVRAATFLQRVWWWWGSKCCAGLVDWPRISRGRWVHAGSKRVWGRMTLSLLGKSLPGVLQLRPERKDGGREGGRAEREHQKLARLLGEEKAVGSGGEHSHKVR